MDILFYVYIFVWTPLFFVKMIWERDVGVYVPKGFVSIPIEMDKSLIQPFQVLPPSFGCNQDSSFILCSFVFVTFSNCQFLHLQLLPINILWAKLCQVFSMCFNYSLIWFLELKLDVNVADWSAGNNSSIVIIFIKCGIFSNKTVWKPKILFPLILDYISWIFCQDYATVPSSFPLSETKMNSSVSK